MASGGCVHTERAESGAGEPHESVIEVRTVPAQRRTIDETVPGIGRAEALPKSIMTLTPGVAGQVAEILKTHGDAVHRGEPVVELDKTIAKADLAEKEAQRDTLKAALELLEAPPRAADRRGLEIAVSQASAALERAQTALERLEPLRARKEISEAQLYDAAQIVVQARLQQDVAQAQLTLLLAGPRPEAVVEAKARLAAAEEAVALSRANYELHTLRASIDGVVDSLACHPGQTVAAGAPIGEIVDVGHLNIVVWLPAEAAAAVRPGQIARIVGGLGSPAPDERSHETEPSSETPDKSEAAGDKPASTAESNDKSAEPSAASDTGPSEFGPSKPAMAEANPAEAHEQVVGKVTSIGQIVDPQTGNLPVRALFENRDHRIAVGQTLSVAIVVGTQEAALTVPTVALIDLGEGPLIVVVRDDKAVRVALEPDAIHTHGEWTVVSGVDLKEGEPVVVDGGFNLPENAEVHLASSQSPAAGEERP